MRCLSLMLGYQIQDFLAVLFPFGWAEAAYSQEFFFGRRAGIGYFQEGALGEHPVGSDVLGDVLFRAPVYKRLDKLGVTVVGVDFFDGGLGLDDLLLDRFGFFYLFA